MSGAPMLPERPDPDLVLARLKEAEARKRRGKLRVFFGFAPGVGKTYRMLQVARELVESGGDGREPGVDLVIGLIEDHRRRETAAMVLGLPLLPRREVNYQGRVLREFDLDGALARRPKVILVDELAHTNAPGSRHPKRWQDIAELLDAGIDVFTTLNVQHLESLNDVITQITGIVVRETVPDAVLDDADTIELIDIAPDELLARLGEGKVYLLDQAKQASRHFFRRGNLLALRELALRRTAAHVDDDVRAYRQHHGVVSTWPTAERLLVAVGPAPSSARLIRATARMAAGLRCAWVAAYVEVGPMATRPLAPGSADEARLEAHLRLAESQGATIARLPGGSGGVAAAVLSYARRHNVTRIVLGKPTHARFWDRLRGSLLDDVVRGSGDIEVHVIRGDEGAAFRARPEATPRRPRSLRPYLAALGLVAVTTAVAASLRALFQLPDLEMLFLLAVMVTAIAFGRRPSLFAAALGVAAYDFFFVAPFHTFSVADRSYVLTFAMMFATGFVISDLAVRLRRQERAARSREQRTTLLYSLARALASADDPAAIAQVAVEHGATAFEAQVALFGVGARAAASTSAETGELVLLGKAPASFVPEPGILAVARWAHEHGELAGRGTDTLPGAAGLSAPLRAGASRLGVFLLAEAPSPGRTDDEGGGWALRAEQRAFLDGFCRQVAGALERVRLAEQARAAALRAKAEELRASLLSTVSHDLRTPLASITGAATVLRDEAALDVTTREDLVNSIVDQAERLERLVGNLLDMTRLESGAVALRRDWVPLDEMIGSALTRLESRLEDRPVHVAIAEDVPMVFVDPVLFEQVFVNLLENADKYTSAGTPFHLEAKLSDGRVVVSFADEGPGFAPGTETTVFDKFVRGNDGSVAGAGLGLTICKAIIEAHGGQIAASNGPAGGAVVRFSLPIERPAPSVEIEIEEAP
jgi:two-component system, OmpR family, sensor histidine kinase KdpD